MPGSHDADVPAFRDPKPTVERIATLAQPYLQELIGGLSSGAAPTEPPPEPASPPASGELIDNETAD